LIILFGIGYIHFLHFSGDILRIYAVLGLFLLFVQKLNNRILLIAALFLVINSPLIIANVSGYFIPQPPLSEEVNLAEQEGFNNFLESARQAYFIKTSGSYWDILKLNYKAGIIDTFQFQLFAGRGFITLGLFLLGFYVGRLNLFEDKPKNIQFFKNAFLTSGLVSLITGITSFYYYKFFALIGNLEELIGFLAHNIYNPALSLFYVASIVLMYKTINGKKILDYLAPVGKMGLTVYLMQTVFGLLLLFPYGFGLITELGVFNLIGWGIVFFTFQVFFAELWFNYFTMGPVEWVWRCLTDLKLHPIKKKTIPEELILSK
jgi:uncharacterized protein